MRVPGLTLVEIRPDLDMGFSEAAWPGRPPGWASSKATTPGLWLGWMPLAFGLKFLTKSLLIMVDTINVFCKNFLSTLRVLTGDDGVGAPSRGAPEGVEVGLVASITL